MDSPDRRRRLHHRTGGWLRQHKQKILIGIGTFVALVIVGQLLYPHDRALPLATMNGQGVGYQQDGALLTRLQSAFVDSKVTLKGAEGTSVTKTLNELGASPNTEGAVRMLRQYELWQRIIPFSIVFVRPSVDDIDVYFSDVQLQRSADTIAAKLSRPASDARLAITDGTLVVTPAQDGNVVTTEAVKTALTAASFGFADTSLSVSFMKQTPAYGNTDIAPIRQQAEAMINHSITVTAPNGKTFSPMPAVIASWLVLKTQPDHSLKISLDTAAITRYSKTVSAAVATPAGTTTIRLLDGNETSRTTGAAGQTIDTGALTSSIAQALGKDEPSSAVTAEPQVLASPTTYVRSYSQSEMGLRAYVAYVTSTEDIHISLAQIDGNYWTASGRASDSIPSASTYKLYVAMVLFEKIDKGEIKWSDPMLDTNVSTCVEQMIVQSLNACAEQFIANFGRQYINDFLYARGISRATTFTAQDATHTSAADLVYTLKGLANGTLYRGENRNILLDKMGRQIYRNGVPAGTSGSVQDKVGFLWDYNHDAAIVHTSKGSYVVAIMTRGASFNRIAQITTQLERIMYP